MAMDLYWNYHNYIKTKYREELSPSLMSAPLREARIFELICREIPLKIFDGDIIGAHYGPFSEEGLVCERESDVPYTDFFSSDERKLQGELYNNFRYQLFFATAHTCIDYGGLRKAKKDPMPLRKALSRYGLADKASMKNINNIPNSIDMIPIIKLTIEKCVIIFQTENAFTIEEFLEHTCMKAGISADSWMDESCDVYKFQGQIFK